MAPEQNPASIPTSNPARPEIIVAVTGASGSLYGIRLLSALLSRPSVIHLVISRAGDRVMAHETDWNGGDMATYLSEAGIDMHPRAELKQWNPEDLFAPPASGSFRNAGMAVCPCSMKTLGAVASGMSDSLIHRAADVCLKEKRPLVLLTREMPLNLIHLENMTRAARAGATIFPASPGFYFKPETVNDLVDSVVWRVLDHLGLPSETAKRWGNETRV
jgi:4-hydroxy-3-polyprenylbenzoate decarboxylase